MKWVEAAKEGQDYVLSAELKEKRDTIEAEAAEVLKKSGATPCTLYGIAGYPGRVQTDFRKLLRQGGARTPKKGY